MSNIDYSPFIVEFETSRKFPTFHINISKSFDTLINIIEEEGYIKNKDFQIICWRGYDMKHVLRLQKAKIKKDISLLEKISPFLLSFEDFYNLSDNDILHYPYLKNIMKDKQC